MKVFIQHFLQALCIIYFSSIFSMHHEELVEDASFLLARDACYLKQLLTKDVTVEIHKGLYFANLTLSHFFNSEDDKRSNYNEETLGLARLVTQRYNDNSILMKALEQNDAQKVTEVIQKNPYVLTVYSSLSCLFDPNPPLQRAISDAPLSFEALEALIDEGNKTEYPPCWSHSLITKRFPIHVAPTKKIAKLLIKKADSISEYINSKDRYGKTPLWYALFEHKHTALALYYLKHGAHVNAQGNNNDTLLHYAIREDNVAAVELLLHYNACLSIHNKENQTPFELLLERQFLIRGRKERKKIFTLFERRGVMFFPKKPNDCDFLDALKNAKKTLNEKTRKKDFLNLCARLFQSFKCYNTNMIDSRQRGITITNHGYLFNRASFDNLATLIGKEAIDAIKACLDQKYFSAQRSAYHSPLYAISLLKKHSFILSNPAVTLCIYSKLIAAGECNTAIDLLKSSNVNGIDSEGNNLLHRAIIEHNALSLPIEKSKLILKKLFEKNIDSSLRNNDGYTALDLAQLYKQHDWIQWFNRYLMHNFVRVSPYRSWYNDVKEFLKSIDINICNTKQRTMLFCAILNYKIKWISFLLKNGAHVNGADKNGCTPLQYAIQYDNWEAIALLLHHGAVVGTQDILHFDSGDKYKKRMLQQAYDKQKDCSVCCETKREISPIPCKNIHPDMFLCHNCYNAIKQTNNCCPYCHSELGS